MSTEPIHNLAPAPGEQPSPGVPLRLRLAETLVAVGVVVLGLVILVETQDIRVPRALTVVGPRNVPVIVGVSLVLIGIWYAVDVLMGQTAIPSGDSEDADPTLPADWGVLAQLAVVMALYAILMEPAGFVLASAMLFVGTAFAMGSRHIPRDVIIGLVLAVATWLVFDRWLGIRLPPGVLEGMA
ncbi:MAG TPA: tripartite tricarboxylate transporter TctB family protein [Thermomicrobiales bacterium]|nr:tripartite tricarboxylate transporter TctB family protein [Thermomicrobiales bacterium]